MIKNKIAAGFIVLILISNGLAFAEEEPKVAIQKTEGRLEAIVSSQPASSPTPKKNVFKKIVSAPGDIIVTTGRVSSSVTGKIADVCVKSVQTVGGFLLAPIFKTLDLQTKIQEKQRSKT